MEKFMFAKVYEIKKLPEAKTCFNLCKLKVF